MVYMYIVTNTSIFLIVGLTLSQATKALRESRGIALLYFRPLHQKGVRGQRHAPAAPYPREGPGTHCTGGWVGLRAGLDWCGKSRPTGIPNGIYSVIFFFLICIYYFQPVFYRLGMSRGIYNVFSFTHLHYICSFLAALVV